MQASRRFVAVALTALVIPAASSLGREKADVAVSYVLGPSKPLPDGVKAVAVIDAGVQTQGAQQDERERKWSSIAADMIEAMIQNSNAQYGGQLAVAKRSQTKQVLEEQDLRLSGLVEGDTATRAGKLLAVQGLITTKMTISIDVQKGSKAAMDWGGFLGGVLEDVGKGRDRDRDRRQYRVRSDRQVVVRRPPPRVVRPEQRGGDPRDPRVARGPVVVQRRTYLYPQGYRPTQGPREGTGGGMFGGFTFKTKEVEEISRSLTVQVSFSLIDATTGRAIAQYSPPPLRKTDTASPDFMFGGMMDQAELDPVDEFIGELVEKATREFVSTLVPVQYEHKAHLALSGKHGELAIRAIRADDYDTAMRELQTSAASGKDDDGSVSFAMGVVCELKGDYAKAQQMYRQAASAKDVDKDDLPTYLAAKERMGNHLRRIMIPAAGDQNAAAGPGEQPAAPPPQPQAGQPGNAPPPPPPPPPPAPAKEKQQAAPAAPPAATQPAPGGPSSVDDELRILKELEEKDKKK